LARKDGRITPAGLRVASLQTYLSSAYTCLRGRHNGKSNWLHSTSSRPKTIATIINPFISKYHAIYQIQDTVLKNKLGKEMKNRKQRNEEESLRRLNKTEERNL
jgi:hypothetical protein